MKHLHTLFCVGTGPGGADFLTLKAAKILSDAKTIFYPRTKSRSKAFETAKSAIDISHKNCVPLDFSMKKENAEEEYKSAAQKILEELSKNDAALITIGDVPLFSTAGKIGAIVRESGANVEFAAGVSSISAALNSVYADLSKSNGNITIIQGDIEFSNGNLHKILCSDGTKIIMKCAKHLFEIADLISSLGLLKNAKLVFEAGSENQKIVAGEEIKNFAKICKNPYMSIIILEN